MQNFYTLLENKENIDEGKLANIAKNLAIFGGAAAAGAGIGHVTPQIRGTVAGIHDKAGEQVGLQGAGNLARGKENIRQQIANKVGGNEALGALGGAALAAMLRNRLGNKLKNK